MNKILFFAHLKDAIGEESISVDVSGKKVSEVKEFITKEYGMDKLDSAMTAINEEFSTEEEIIQTGDVIAFIPPVSGG